MRTGGSGGGGGGTTTLSTPRYQLAEHRYGREEMLALFDRNYKPPELLTTFPALYVEKTQLPLALVQMTEDETVIINIHIYINITIHFILHDLYFYYIKKQPNFNYYDNNRKRRKLSNYVN